MRIYIWVSFPICWFLRVRTGPKAAKCTAPRPSSPRGFTRDPSPSNGLPQKTRFWNWTLPWNQVLSEISGEKCEYLKYLKVSHSKPPTFLPPPSWHSPHSPHPVWLLNSMVALLAVLWFETLLRPNSFWTSWFLGSLSKTSWQQVGVIDGNGWKVLFIPNESPLILLNNLKHLMETYNRIDKYIITHQLLFSITR